MPYCQFCGSKLEDGQTCTCELAQADASSSAQEPQVEQPATAQQQPTAAQQPQAEQPAAAQQPPTQSPAAAQQPPVRSPSAAKNQAATILKRLHEYLGTYISYPEQAVRSVLDTDDLVLPIVLSVVRLLAMGLAIYGLLRKACENVLSTITTTLLSYDNTSNILTASLNASLPAGLLYGALIAAVGMALFIFMIYVVVRLQRGGPSSAGLFKASAANGILTSILLLLSFLLSFISVKFCVIFIALAMLSWIICGALTLRVVSPNSSSGGAWLLYFVGVILIIVAGYYAIPPLFLRAVGGISASYMGRTLTLQNIFDLASSNINSALAEMGAGSIMEIFTSQLKNGFNEFISEMWQQLMS